MRRTGNRLATPLFALLLAAPLAFGVTTSFAQAEDVAVAACPNNYDDLLGDCNGNPEVCNYRCQQRGYAAGDCITDMNGDCCVCMR